ncbi:MAG: fumarylacetoacetate hydrolase family protein [Lysobacterales bacterium]
MSILLFNTPDGPVAQHAGYYHEMGEFSWDALLNRDDLARYLLEEIAGEPPVDPPARLLAPIGHQEIWAAGVTYFRSREARIEESKDAGGGDFYDRVYAADRPELFLKATAPRVTAPGGKLRLRRDSRWIVPEPELTLVINKRNEIIGYTIGNDLSCRDIEGENPLYLPQAKIFDGCASIGPGLLIQNEPLPPSTRIHLEILRQAKRVVDDETDLSKLKRTPDQLVDFLTRECSFPAGCFLMTGTGIVPADDFSLQSGDEIRITIEPIGTLVNTVA